MFSASGHHIVSEDQDLSKNLKKVQERTSAASLWAAASKKNISNFKKKNIRKKGKLPAAIEGHRHHIIVGYNYIQAAHKQW